MQCYININKLYYTINEKIILDIEGLYYDEGLHAIIGPNGAGKSTLLKSILKIININVRDIDICGNEKELDLGIISYVPPTPTVDVLARVEDVIHAGLYKIKYNKKIIDHVFSILEDFGLYEIRGRLFSTLSSGEQRLVCVARALAREPKIILLDEPLSFLDIKNQVKLINLLREYVRAKGAVVLLTTHHLSYLNYFDTITVLSGGKALTKAKPTDIDEMILSKVFGVNIVKANIDGLGPIFIPVASDR